MRVLLPLPDRDFDVTEVAVPWRLLHDAGHEVVFATERGTVPAADPLLLSGVLFGQLGAEPEPRRFYRDLLADDAYRAPVRWSDLEPEAYYLTAWRRGRYYRTYPAYVQDEVTAALDSPAQFTRGPVGLSRGTATDDGPAFVVRDGNYVSARRPGDAYLFSRSFLELLHTNE